MLFKKFSLVCLLFFSLAEASQFQSNIDYNVPNFSKNFQISISKKMNDYPISSNILKRKFFPNSKNILNEKKKILSKNFQSKIISKNLDTKIQLIKKITFLGNNFFSNQSLLDMMKNFDILESKIFSYSQVQKFIKHIKDIYYQNGFLNCCVEIVGVPVSSDRVQVNVMIKEGKISRISSLEISGNTHFSTTQIKEILLKNKPFWLFNFFSKSIYAPNKFKKHLDNLLKLYHMHGYLDCQIFPVYSVSPKNLFLTDIQVRIQEGALYEYGKMEILGIKDPFFLKNLKKILKKFQQKYNSSYNLKNICVLKKKLKNLFLKFGYAKVFLKTKILKDINYKKINFYFYLKKDKQYFLNKIFFHGATYSQEIFLRKILQKYINRYYDFSLLKKCCLNFLKTGFFESVSIKHVPIFKNSNKINVFFILKEENRRNCDFSSEYNFQEGLKLHLLGWKKNIFGTGWKLKGNIWKGPDSIKGDMNISAPSIFFKNYLLQYHIFYHTLKNQYFLSSNILQNDVGSEIQLRTKKRNHKQMLLSLGYINTKNFNLNLNIPTVKLRGSFYTDVIQKYFNTHNYVKNFFVRTAFDYNTLFPTVCPETGNLFRFFGQFNLPASTELYHNFAINLEKYIPILDKNNIILHGCANFKFGINFLKDLFKVEPEIIPEEEKEEIVQNIEPEITTTVIPEVTEPENAEFTMIVKDLTTPSIDTTTVVPEVLNSDIISSSESEDKSLEVQKNKIQPVLFLDFLTQIKAEILFPHLRFPIPLFRNFQFSIFTECTSNWNLETTYDMQIVKDGTYHQLNPHSMTVMAGFFTRWFSPLGPIKFTFSKSVFHYVNENSINEDI
ncbi:POTRA domain-containing protein [Buchnera aphidicola]